ncbi:hypothetical protein AALB39_04175 [Lachnospiraceae bacterium 54-53]
MIVSKPRFFKKGKQMEISLRMPTKKFEVLYSECYPAKEDLKRMIVNAECEKDISDYLIETYGCTAIRINFLKWN